MDTKPEQSVRYAIPEVRSSGFVLFWLYGTLATTLPRAAAALSDDEGRQARQVSRARKRRASCWRAATPTRLHRTDAAGGSSPLGAAGNDFRAGDGLVATFDRARDSCLSLLHGRRAACSCCCTHTEEEQRMERPT